MNTCPKCKSNEIYSQKASKKLGASKFHLSGFSMAMLSGYVCTDCGYVEYYMEDPSDLEKLKDKL